MTSATDTIATTGPSPRKKKKKKKGREGSSPIAERLQFEVYGLIVMAFSVLLFLSLLSFRPEDVDLTARTAYPDGYNLAGPVGAHIAHALLSLFGLGAFALNAAFLLVGLTVLGGKRVRVTGRDVILGLMALVAIDVLFQVSLTGQRILGVPAGGFIGAYGGEGCRTLFSDVGTYLVASTALLISLILVTGVSLRDGMRRMAAVQLGLRKAPGVDIESSVGELKRGWLAKLMARLSPERDSLIIGGVEPMTDDTTPDLQLPADEQQPGQVTRVEKQSKLSKKLFGRREAKGDADETPVDSAPARRKKKAKEDESEGPKIVESDAMRKARSGVSIAGEQETLPLGGPESYELPSLSMLDYEAPKSEALSRKVLRENAVTLEQKLADFGVQGSVVEIHPGPVVTMYEFKPAAGVKISKIANLSDDLSMALAALRVRIVAPIPGKSVVGIEVPNQAREIVYLKEILGDGAFAKAKKSAIPLALGKDIVGYPRAADLTKMPHLLVAGSTGSGKSVAINSFICSILYRSTPADVRLLMVDPKMLELSPYEGIPHLLLPVVTDPKKAAVALKWAVSEMERRYSLMAETGVRNILSYNTRVEKIIAELQVEHKAARSIVLDGDGEGEAGTAEELPERLPFIVIIIDELADLMMVASKDVETAIARLAQMARAAGIHLIMATQRPSVDVITGLIKANFPARMSFHVSSKVDSRTILDRQGAENLLGQGDMLFLPPGSSKLTRIHGAFVSEEEVARITAFLRAQGRPEYCMEILKTDDEDEENATEREYDEFYDQALAIVAESGQASISYLQRRLKIGYNRAARIVEMMEEEGVIGPQRSSGRREVLVEPH